MRMEVRDDPLNKRVIATIWLGQRDLAMLGRDLPANVRSDTCRMSDKLYYLAALAKKLEQYHHQQPLVSVIEPAALPKPDIAIDAEFTELS